MSGYRERDKERDQDYSKGKEDAGDGQGEERRFSPGEGTRKKACKFCTDADYFLDYKNVKILQGFVSEHGKIVARRISGNCARHQRQMTTEIQRARNLALVGFITPGY